MGAITWDRTSLLYNKFNGDNDYTHGAKVSIARSCAGLSLLANSYVGKVDFAKMKKNSPLVDQNSASKRTNSQ